MKKRKLDPVAQQLLWTVGLLLMMLIGGLALFGSLVRTSHAQGPDPTPGGWQLFFPPYPSPNERLGFGLAGSVSGLTDYDVAQLSAGWYTNWGAAQNPPRPAGLVYIQVVRLDGPFRSCLRSCDSYKPTCTGIIDYSNCRSGYPPNPAAVGVSPSRSTIRQIAQTNPGSVWLIGNEPDRIMYMDDVCPDEYAMVYHELYHLIKEADPTAKVAVGGIVQATPIRLQYLSIVMCVYEHTYGTKLPADLWNVHAFILSEGPPPDWGADIPPGMVTPALIQWRNLWDCDDMDIFKQQIHDFRQWMANHNERDKPLIISEYGILMPSSLCDGDETHYDPYCGYKPNGKPNGRPYDYPRVTAFMQATFDYFLGVDPDGIDPALGYPDDGNRLVQAWNWYSLNEDWMYNGNLFHSSNKQITALGMDFKNYATPLKVDYKDLLPWELSFEHTPDLFAGDLVTVTISSQVFNMGNEAAQDVLVRFWDGEPGVGTQLGGDQVVSNVPSRYQGAPTAAITWTTMAMDVHDMYVEVNPAPHSITESVYANNILSATLDFKSDLTVNAIAFDPPNPLLKDGQEVTITVSGQVQNVGHLAAVSVTVRFWDGDPDGSGTQIGSDQIIATDPADPLGQDEVATAQVTWTTGVSGTHQIYVRVDPDNAIGEIDEDNNQKMETIWVAADRIFLPLILKGSSGVSGASVTSDPRDFLKIKLPTPTPTA